jgi:hypothetical protein
MALAMPSLSPKYFEYFLDHKNHRPGTPTRRRDPRRPSRTGSTRSSTRPTDF